MESSGTIERYVSAFRSVSGRPAPPWLDAIRRSAIERFRSIGFPTTRLEDWKYTNVAPLVQTPFRPIVEPSRDGVGAPAIDALAPGSRIRLVVVNGHVAADLSALDRLPRGVTVSGLGEALDSSGMVEANLGRHATFDEDGFAALNTAFATDGAVVDVAEGVSVEEPIEIVFVAAATDDGPVLVQPRILVVLGRGSRATVVESWASTARGATLSNVVGEIVVGDAAALAHVKIVRDAEKGAHVATTRVRVARDGRYASSSFALGGALARHDLSVLLDAPGAEASLDGLYLVGGRSHVDNHTTIDHAKPHGTSRELYKGILDGRARAVFSGKVVVRPEAQKTDARQTNRNLVLSDRAEIDTKPELRILADDVKCSHGAAIGQLEDDAVFYFRSRGMSEATARRLLTLGFANEIVRRVDSVPLRERLERQVEESLAGLGGVTGGNR